MSLPAAVSPDPIAVLVLAWDEAAPAVRALVEATQASAPALDSLRVMVPQADAPEGLSAAEYLPLPPTPAVNLPELPEPEPQILPAETALLPATSEAPATGAERPSITIIAAGPAPLPATPAPPVATAVPAPLAWSAVRIVRLGSLSLPQLAVRAGQPLPAPIWTGTTAAPAAPYLGATVGTEQNPAVASPGLPVSGAALTLLAELRPAPTPAGQLPVPSLGQSALPRSPTQAAPLYDTTASIAQAPDLEADLALAEAEELIGLESAEASTLPPDDLAATTELTPAQADWEAALVALRQPATQPATAGAVPAEPAAAVVSEEYPALRPAAQHYPAPDLNFQIIQYARFAVPVALAEPPFAVLYAPAWPTWLAAQELRQRTGRPLVLHVATLAAADDESVETATGWIAELQRQALRRADLLIAETPALAQRLRRELALEASQVLVIPAAEAGAIAQALRGAQVRPVAA
jgi:hypothetical protein